MYSISIANVFNIQSIIYMPDAASAGNIYHRDDDIQIGVHYHSFHNRTLHSHMSYSQSAALLTSITGDQLYHCDPSQFTFIIFKTIFSSS
ncbi:hypothetical protein MAR_019357 [Mya arenaria]|uniref:Uncharacterized protein n=1 Tax=Mya arenaria TaxID=6604 RepID=A0ABY7EK60_MYAAR|nr:hypothetical protein MAR_019357 [Mya arenaria]